MPEKQGRDSNAAHQSSPRARVGSIFLNFDGSADAQAACQGIADSATDCCLSQQLVWGQCCCDSR